MGDQQSNKINNIKCWEFFSCKKRVCPAYESGDLRCWLFSGTHCRNEIQGKFLEKMEICVDCKVFRTNMDLFAMNETIELMNRQLKEFRQIVNDREDSLRNALKDSQKRQAEISALLEASRSVHEYHDFTSSAKAIFHICKNLIGATSGYIALLSKDGTENEVLFLDTGGFPCTVDPKLPMPIRGLRAKAYRKNKAVYHNDFPKSEFIKFMPKGHVRLKNVLFAPLTLKEKTVGVLGLANKPEGFNEIDANMATAFGELAAIALSNKWAEEALITERDKAKSYLDIAGVIIVVIDSDQKVSLINKRGCEILGYDEEEIIGKNWFDTFIPKRNRDEVKATFKKLIAGEVEPVEYFENPVLTRNKDERIIAWHNTFLRDEDSKIIATLSSGEDITEHKKADEEIQKLNEELNQRVIELTMSNQDLDAFNYTVSHDLKVPLVIIGGFTNSFLKKHSDKLDTKEKDMFHAIRKHTQEMERLIKDLLAFSRAGRQKIKPTEIDMGNLITTILDELNPLSEGRMIKYDVKILPTAYGDQALIKQVFINLISNAIKFTTNKKMAVIEVGGWTEESENVYCVKDNGIGFSSQDSEKLFTVFQRLHGIEELEGSGVGLSIVQRIVKRHGGRGWAEGKVNEGASIYFSLPNKISEDS